MATRRVTSKKSAAKDQAPGAGRKRPARKADLKTKENEGSVEAFLAKADRGRREDCFALLKLMQRATGEPPRMWGASIVGFGRYHYHYESGREGDFFLTGFSPRKQNLTIYIMPGFETHAVKVKNLGMFTTGKSCLYVKRLSDIDLKVLEGIVKDSVDSMRKKHGQAGRT